MAPIQPLMEPSPHYSMRTPEALRPHATPAARLPHRPAADRELILVALGDDRIRGPLEKFLGLRGYRVRGVRSAAEAVDAIRTDRPAAAIVDLGEAPGPGLEVAVAMPLPRPVLMLSSAPQTTRQLARVRPRTRLVPKPCSLVMVIDLLQEMLTSADRLGRTEPTVGPERQGLGRSASASPFSMPRPLVFDPA